ncbi:hypothetical protein [Glycomyces sp. YM15]|uniref:hypothetical protein n=1 Tax=Glycomyces sp. YM15 TaxID=2800446 RepID=UPI0019661AC4|nr:hypothetical protein [Glycomyces sp. YM15]
MIWSTDALGHPDWHEFQRLPRVLLGARRKALIRLKSRGILSYGDFRGFDNAPLDAA